MTINDQSIWLDVLQDMSQLIGLCILCSKVLLFFMVFASPDRVFYLHFLVLKGYIGHVGFGDSLPGYQAFAA